MWDATAVRTVPAPLRPPPGGRVRLAAAELAVAALTVVSGLQLLRLMVATMVGVYRDRWVRPCHPALSPSAGRVGLLAAPVARCSPATAPGHASPVSPWSGGRSVRERSPLALAPVCGGLFSWLSPSGGPDGGQGWDCPAARAAFDTALAGSSAAGLALVDRVNAALALPGPAAVWSGRRGRPRPAGGTEGKGPGRGPARAGAAVAFLHALLWQNLGWHRWYCGCSGVGVRW